jgi:hypothetical protein
MQRLQVELIGGLRRHKLHRWTLHHLGDRLRVATDRVEELAMARSTSEMPGPLRQRLRPKLAPSLGGGRHLDVCNAGEVALGDEQSLLVGTVEIRAVDRAPEVGEEHPPAFEV